MKLRQWLSYMKGRYFDPKYSFKDRLYFLFGTAGLFSAGAAYLAAIGSSLPQIAAVASMISFVIMLLLMGVSFFMQDISANRVVCSVFLNFFMFPVLFWVTGGVNCGMVFYFILGICVSTLILEGRIRTLVLILSLAFYTACLYLGFRYPEYAYPLSYSERSMDTISSFLIVALFIIAVIVILSREYEREHSKVLQSAEALKQQAITDGLTTLYNQRYITEAMLKAAEACEASKTPASIILFDIDDFKRINDTCGHLRGNQVLCQFAALLQAEACENAVMSRYGGEEFVILLLGYPGQEAFAFAERLRLAVREDKKLQELTDYKFSISGGVAQYGQGISVDEWIRRADMNMYAAKAGGKNRIVG